MRYNPDKDFLDDMVPKPDLFEIQGKELLQTLLKKFNYSVYGGNIRRDVNDQIKSVTENWMREIHDDRVKEWWPMESCK